MSSLVSLAIVFVLFIPGISEAKNPKIFSRDFRNFSSSGNNELKVNQPASISSINGALQVTPDTENHNFNLTNLSGRILFKRPFKLWEEDGRVASFNSSFVVNIYQVNNMTPGEGFAFIIAPDLDTPPGSEGQYLGLTNSNTDGNSSNHLVAVELDTVKQDFDPDNNHIGLDINSVRSKKTVSLSDLGIVLVPDRAPTIFYMVWIQYDSEKKVIKVYMAERDKVKPMAPVLQADLDLRNIVKQHSYLGFAASTGKFTELHCVLNWSMTVELLPENKRTPWLKYLVEVGVPVVVLFAAVMLILGYYHRKKKVAKSEQNIRGTLKTLPGMPREFRFRDLKKATNNFDEKQKLGQGGFGVVYKGVLPKEDVEVAVKKFCRDKLESKDDFLSELTIINRLRHKHLVRLLGWCHRNGMLLLVYDYMPNGSLDNHLFFGAEKTILGWNLRYKIVSGVASALHYLHNEYEQKVVHRDLKASNIMLDSDFNARLGDFGLARMIDNEKTSYAELEGVHGTMGYIAPECFHTGKATRESDVYGFGAVLLEVVCGRRPWSKFAKPHFLVDWVWRLYKEGRLLETVDEGLGSEFVPEEAGRLLLLGLACSHPIASKRPKTEAIVQIISGTVAVPYVPPVKPDFIWRSPWEPVGGDSSIGVTEDTMSASTTSHFESGSAPQYSSREV